MARVSAFVINGLKLWFWSADHEPPHFHAKKMGEWEVRVNFLLPVGDMIEVKWNERPLPKRRIDEICRLAEAHRVELLEQWEGLAHE